MAKLGAKPFSCGAQPFKKPRLLFNARFQLFLGYSPSEQTGFVCVSVCVCVHVCARMSLNNMSHFLFVCVLVLLLFKSCIMHNVYALALCKCTVWACVPM